MAEAISKGSAKPEDRYYISLPTPLAHSNHDLYSSYMNLGSDCSLDAAISDQIYKLVNRGVTTIDQIQTKLYEFVQSSLAQNNEVRLCEYKYMKSRLIFVYLVGCKRPLLLPAQE